MALYSVHQINAQNKIIKKYVVGFCLTARSIVYRVFKSADCIIILTTAGSIRGARLKLIQRAFRITLLVRKFVN